MEGDSNTDHKSYLLRQKKIAHIQKLIKERVNKESTPYKIINNRKLNLHDYYIWATTYKVLTAKEAIELKCIRKSIFRQSLLFFFGSTALAMLSHLVDVNLLKMKMKVSIPLNFIAYGLINLAVIPQIADHHLPKISDIMEKYRSQTIETIKNNESSSLDIMKTALKREKK
jgi:hypothetical protein